MLLIIHGRGDHSIQRLIITIFSKIERDTKKYVLYYDEKEHGNGTEYKKKSKTI